MDIKKLIPYIVIVVLGILLLLSTRECSKHKRNASDYKDMTSLFKPIEDKHAGNIVVQKDNVISDPNLIKRLSDTISYLKSVKTQVKVVIRTVIKRVEIPIEKPIYRRDSNQYYLEVPAPFKKSDTWYALSGTIGNKGLIELDSLTFISKPSIYIGFKKKSFKDAILFKKSERTIVYKDANPYSKVVDMSNFEVRESHPAINIGIQGGYGITKSGFSPYLGIGIQYNILSR